MAVKKKGLGKGLDSLIPDNKPAKKNTETVQKAEEKKEEDVVDAEAEDVTEEE